MNNLVVLTPDAKIGVVPMDEIGHLVACKFTHVLEEYDLRKRSFPQDLMMDHPLPEPVGPRRGNVGSARNHWNAVLPTLPEEAVVKYGHIDHLRAAIEGRGIRLAPASSYADASLGPHRYDNEQARKVYLRPDDGHVRLVQRADGTVVDPPISIPVVGNMTLTTTMESDYYVWCTSAVLEPRLFVDFSADACLIIRDRDEFLRRLAWAAGQALRSHAPPLRSLSIESSAVQYYDPYDPPKGRDALSVPWHKPLMYLYQREWRFIVLLDPPSVAPLPILQVDPGPMTDIAEIVFVGELDGWRHPHRHAIVRSGRIPGLRRE